MWRPAPRHLRGLALGLWAGLLAWGLAWAGLLQGGEDLTWSWRVRLLAAPSPFTSRIKIIAVDQASLDWAAQVNGLSWPWPRQVYAPIVQFCARAGARAMALDIIFSEPSPLADDDAELGRALAAGPPSVGAVMLGRSTGSTRAWPPALAGKAPELAEVRGWPQGAPGGLTMPLALMPVSEIAVSFSRLGNVMEEPDSDQVVRRITPLRAFGDRALFNLGLSLACAASPCRATWGPEGLGLGAAVIPLDAQGAAILRFRGGPGTHDKFSAAAVIQSELQMQQGQPPTLDPSLLRDCHVLLGFTAPGLHDLRATPVAALYPGLEVHATALDNLLAGDFLRPAPGWAGTLWVLLLGLGGGLIGMLVSRGWHYALAMAMILPLPAGAGLAAYAVGWWWPVAAPTLASAMGLVAAAVWSYAIEGRQRRFIKNAFRHYLSPEVIERILADPDRLRLGGERRDLTIFFSDLAGFTSISERLDPHDLATLLNEYLTAMTEVILAEGGTLDKYEGDAIVAFWNAPLDQADHAMLACRAALDCQRVLRERQAPWAAKAGGPLAARIGLNSGPVVVGNLGSHQRFDYTVLGDAANLASRLEGANKLLGTGIMVSQATWERTGGVLPGRELGLLKVVGRAEPVRVYEPLSPEAAANTGLLADFARGLDLVRQGGWEEAWRVFAVLTDDPASCVYAARCRELMDAPGEVWDGVWVLQQK